MSSLAPWRSSATPHTHKRPQKWRIPQNLTLSEQAPVALKLGASWKPLAEGPRPEPLVHPKIYTQGRCGHIPVWYTRESWLYSVRKAFRSPAGRAHRARLGGLSERSFMAVMHADAATADHRTGRNLYTAHSTVAARTKLSVQVVQRARQICEHLGLSATIDPGRHLPAADRELRRTRTGKFILQIRKAATRVLTMPARIVASLPADLQPRAWIEYPPRRGSKTSLSSPFSLTNARSRVQATNQTSRKKTPQAPASMDARRLAARLAAQNRRLIPDRSLVKLSQVLETRLGTDLQAWTAPKLIERIDQARMKLAFTLPSVIADGAAFMDWMLSQADLTPPQTYEQIQIARQAAIKATQAARAALKAAASPEAKRQRAAGIALCRAALRQARSKD